MSTRDIVFVALFAALTAALGLFPPVVLPVVGVPITAQSTGVMLAGAIAGAKRGGAALALFVLLVCAGLPLMAGGRGGLGIVMGPGGGFVLMWPVAAFVIGLLYERNLRTLTVWKEALILVLGGVVLTYAVGIPWIAAVARVDLAKAAIGSAWFLPGDAAKVVLAILVARAVRRAYPTLQPR
ncbi:biotin transporter BioY [Methylobacterium terrae]|uniref:Biotin transporter n=1 Tax=Methylobacterium terrae TaxID=2202827 RepID=A0A2U8WR70_9HYPH|nr:biotin transporter BioY [Methylobacterium terrae]AWN48008.1 biotin transporter BioY [Methylobacterium terrae]